MPTVIQDTQQTLGSCVSSSTEQISSMSHIHSVAAERTPPRHLPGDSRVNGQQTTSESGIWSHLASFLSNDHVRCLLQWRDADQHTLASGNGVLALNFYSWRVLGSVLWPLEWGRGEFHLYKASSCTAHHSSLYQALVSPCYTSPFIHCFPQ